MHFACSGELKVIGSSAALSCWVWDSPASSNSSFVACHQSWTSAVLLLIAALLYWCSCSAVESHFDSCSLVRQASPFHCFDSSSYFPDFHLYCLSFNLSSPKSPISVFQHLWLCYWNLKVEYSNWQVVCWRYPCLLAVWPASYENQVVVLRCCSTQQDSIDSFPGQQRYCSYLYPCPATKSLISWLYQASSLICLPLSAFGCYSVRFLASSPDSLFVLRLAYAGSVDDAVGWYWKGPWGLLIRFWYQIGLCNFCLPARLFFESMPPVSIGFPWNLEHRSPWAARFSTTPFTDPWAPNYCSINQARNFRNQEAQQGSQFLLILTQRQHLLWQMVWSWIIISSQNSETAATHAQSHCCSCYSLSSSSRRQMTSSSSNCSFDFRQVVATSDCSDLGWFSSDASAPAIVSHSYFSLSLLASVLCCSSGWYHS